MKLVLKNKTLPDVSINELSAGTVFRFFKNKTLEQSVKDEEIYIKLQSADRGFRCAQLSGDCAVVKKYGPFAGYEVNCKIKAYNLKEPKKERLPLGVMDYGSTVMLYLGDNSLEDDIYMIGNDPIEKKLITLVSLETGEVRTVSDEVLCVKILSSLIIKGK